MRLNQDRSEGLDGNVSELILADLRGLIWPEIGPNSDFADLAERANLNKETIIRFMFHSTKKPQTRRPQFETIVKLAKALGRADLLAKTFAGEHEAIPRGKKRKK